MVEDIRRQLGDTLVGRRLLYMQSTTSTNDVLKALALQGEPEGTVILAGEQTKGKGRLGRSFVSLANKGLYMSALLTPALPMERLLPLTGLAAEAMARAVERAAGERPKIKWVNDLILHGKKICGILTEMVTGPKGRVCLIVGIGLNLTHRREDFPPELREKAGSIQSELGRTVAPADMAAAMIMELNRLYGALLGGDTACYLAAYKADCLTVQQPVLLLQNGQEIPAFALGVGEDLSLLVRYSDGSTGAVQWGEASVRGQKGYV